MTESIVKYQTEFFDKGIEYLRPMVLKDVAKDLEIEIHLVRKNNKITEGRTESKRPHHIYRDFFDNTKIYNIKKEVKKIENENN